jgi:hypothetical protein
LAFFNRNAFHFLEKDGLLTGKIELLPQIQK